MDSAADCDAQGDGVLAYGVGDWTPGEKKKPGGLTKLGVRADRLTEVMPNLPHFSAEHLLTTADLFGE